MTDEERYSPTVAPSQGERHPVSLSIYRTLSLCTAAAEMVNYTKAGWERVATLANEGETQWHFISTLTSSLSSPHFPLWVPSDPILPAHLCPVTATHRLETHTRTHTHTHRHTHTHAVTHQPTDVQFELNLVKNLNRHLQIMSWLFIIDYCWLLDLRRSSIFHLKGRM